MFVLGNIGVEPYNIAATMGLLENPRVYGSRTRMKVRGETMSCMSVLAFIGATGSQHRGGEVINSLTHLHVII